MDILQSLIQLPLSPRIDGSLRELRKAYKVFVYEFSKIETQINNTFYSLYIFRNMVNIINNIRELYVNPNTREKAVGIFQDEIFDQVNKIAKFCNLKNVNYENLLCSILAFSEQLEYHIYTELTEWMQRKMAMYNNLEIKCIEHMYTILDMNFKDSYKFNKNTNVHIFNIPQKTHDVVDLIDIDDEMLEYINKLPQFSKGAYIYSLVKEESEDEETEETETEEAEEEESEDEKTEESETEEAEEEESEIEEYEESEIEEAEEEESETEEAEEEESETEEAEENSKTEIEEKDADLNNTVYFINKC
jgi:hypothetical protein